MFDFMTHGRLMDEAGDAGGGGGVAVDTAVDTSTETALVPMGETDLSIVEAGEGSDDDSQVTDLVTTTEPIMEHGRPSKSTSAALAVIKATHPQLAKAVPRALAVESRLRADFPGQNPFDAIRSMQRTLKSIGGEQGLAEIRASLADMEEMDLLYAGGDPRMLEKMTDSPEGKAAFVKLAPHAFAKYQQLAPNAFTKYMAGVIMNDLLSQRVDMTIERISSMTPREIAGVDGAKIPNPVIAELVKIDAYFKRLQDFDKLPSEEVATPATNDPRKAELDQREQNLTRQRREMELQGWRGTADSEKNRIFSQSWATETKGRRISAVDKEDIQARFASRLPIVLKNVPGFMDSLRNYFESDDKDGYLRYLQSLHAKYIPLVLRAEIQRRYGVAKATTAAATETVTAAGKAALETGFKRVAAAPHMNEVNTRLTNPAMWGKKQAMLKNGDKVQWG